MAGFLGGVSDQNFVQDSELSVDLSSTFEVGSLQVKAKVFTSQLDTIYGALEWLIRDPSGCFEQTSSTTYPLVMALMVM